jgi:hypothetical protein
MSLGGPMIFREPVVPERGSEGVNCCNRGASTALKCRPFLFGRSTRVRAAPLR